MLSSSLVAQSQNSDVDGRQLSISRELLLGSSGKGAEEGLRIWASRVETPASVAGEVAEFEQVARRGLQEKGGRGEN